MAKRDNAKKLFKAHIDSLGGELQADKQFLTALKAYQEQVGAGRGLGFRVWGRFRFWAGGGLPVAVGVPP